MTLSVLLDDLQAASVQVWAEAGELRFRAPKGALTPALRTRLKDMKPDLIAALDPDAQRYEPFPQTPIQQAYVVGRTHALDHGGMAANSYIEFDTAEVDASAMQTTLNEMIAQHDMLRTILIDQNRQQVLKKVPEYRMELTDLRDLSPTEQDQSRAKVRFEMSQKTRDPGTWPLFEMRLTRADAGWRLHTCIDLLILDAWSTKLFFGEWFARIAGQDVPDPPRLAFKACLEKAAFVASQSAVDQAYWSEALETLPSAPKLPAPWPAAPDQLDGAFRRLAAHIEASDWRAFLGQCKTHGVTPTSALATAFANVLSRWSENEDVALNLTLFDRPDVHPDIDRVLGEFTNTTLIGFDAMTRSFAEQARSTQLQLLERLEHSAVSGVDVLRQLRQKTGAFSGALMPVVLTSLLIGEEGEERDTGDWTHAYGVSQTPQVTLDHQLFRERGGLSFNWDVSTQAIDMVVASAAFDAYATLIRDLARNPQAWDTPPSRALPAYQQRARHAIHAPTARERAEPLASDFWHKLEGRADAPAVIWSGGTMTHEQLARAAFALSQRMQDLGVGPCERVMIALEKGPAQIVAVLATLYLGAAYVPVDPRQPIARLDQIAQQTVPACVVAEGDLRLGTAPCVKVQLAVRNAKSTLREIVENRFVADPDGQAYVLFTSGTTGTPKGVSMSHHAVQNTLSDMRSRFGLGPSDRVLSVSALNFDLSVYDVFATLDAGGAIVLPDPDQERNPEHMWHMAKTQEVSVWNSVPTLLEMLLTWVEGQSNLLLPSLRLALVSGDWVPMDLGQRLGALAPARLIALGGATEAAIWSNWQDMSERSEHWTSVPYGQPLSNQYYRVLDAYGCERPDLVPGRLHIGGHGLATAYWRDPDQTERAFSRVSGERLYETGDYGRFWPNQTLEFMGRKDQQVKLAGHRVELGEITCALETHESISRAIVSVHDGMLLAHVVGDVEEEAIKAYAAERLPQYMVPRRIIVVAALPLSSNGKIDRKKLPLPDSLPVSKSVSASGQVAEVLSGLLSAKRIDPDRNFFELGLSSVDLVEAHRQLNERLPFELPVADLFVHTTLTALDEHLASLASFHKCNEDAA